VPVEHAKIAAATRAMRPRVVETVVAAFDADPAFRYFFDDADSFRAQATEFTGRLFDERVGKGTVWVVQAGAAVAMWDGPAPAGGPAPAYSTAPDLPSHVLARLEQYDSAVDAALPREPHWYLGVVATHPAYAGRRWGRRLIEVGLELAVDAGLAAYLETTNPRNIDLYRAGGWEVTGSVAVPGLDIWVMRHPGGSRDAS
jgi:ribosomal protein S18 acetylase RimI-like enzyme